MIVTTGISLLWSLVLSLKLIACLLVNAEHNHALAGSGAPAGWALADTWGSWMIVDVGRLMRATEMCSHVMVVIVYGVCVVQGDKSLESSDIER